MKSPNDLVRALSATLQADGVVYFDVKVIPKAKKTEIVEVLMEGEEKTPILKIKVAAVPERGKANDVLRDFISQQFSVRKGDVSVVSGASSPRKVIKIVKE